MSDQDRDLWNARYRDRSITYDDRPPDPFLIEVADSLPTRGRALDVAGGDGRNAVWMANRGLDVTLADISTEAIQIVRSRMPPTRGSITTLEIDFERDPFPPGPWELIVCCSYLDRRLYRDFADHLGRAGLLLVVHPTLRNLERSERPSARYLLDDGELPTLLDGWTILRYQEGWRSGPPWRHDARCLAQRPLDLTTPGSKVINR